jgi:hypothetical protein
VKVWQWRDTVHGVEFLLAFHRQKDLQRIAARVGFVAPTEPARHGLRSPLGEMALLTPGQVLWRDLASPDSTRWYFEDELPQRAADGSDARRNK